MDLATVRRRTLDLSVREASRPTKATAAVLLVLSAPAAETAVAATANIDA